MIRVTKTVYHPQRIAISSWFDQIWSNTDLVPPPPPPPVRPLTLTPTTSTTLPGLGLSSRRRSPLSAHRLFKPPAPPIPIPVHNLQYSNLTTNQYKTNIIAHLSQAEPRRALHLFKQSLLHLATDHQVETTTGLIWLFFNYKENDIAFEAVVHLANQGYRVPATVSIKLLRSSYAHLLRNNDDLVKVIRWLEEGITLEADTMEESLVETVLELLMRSGRTDNMLQIFEAYLKAKSTMGGNNCWCTVISALGENGDLASARDYFDRWRGLWREEHAGDTGANIPDRPYLSLLDQLTAIEPSYSNAPYQFLSLLQHDNVPLSTSVFNSLLRLELSRRQYGSFWGLWSKMDQGNWKKNESSWKLAIKARTWELASGRKRSRSVKSPLQDLAGYSSCRTPRMRLLFREFLIRHLLDTNHRPSLRLPTSSATIMTASTLNSFLALFVSVADWEGATVVLQHFGVVRVEPNEKTHGNIVVSIIRAWEKRKLDRDDPLEDALGMERKWRLDRVAGGIEMLKRILASRKMRVVLWTEDPTSLPPVDPELSEEEKEEKEESDVVISATEIFTAPRPPPGWMVKQELRDTSYLIEFLQRCQGSDDKEWTEGLVQARLEILPPKFRTVNSTLSSSPPSSSPVTPIIPDQIASIPKMAKRRLDGTKGPSAAKRSQRLASFKVRLKRTLTGRL